MRFLSLFSGIEAASRAWVPLGWTCVGVAEIEPFPCAVLAHHYPGVPNLGDITKISQEQIEALGHVDIVVGGFPCQDLSIAGNRKGLRNNDGTATRSGLFFTAVQIAEWSRCRWTLIENVPGLLSSNAGGDFAAVVGEMVGCEFGVPGDRWKNAGAAVGPRGLVEWATLDAQFFGVPQRRRRIFLVRDSGDWSSRPPVLFERESLLGHPAKSRSKGQTTTGSIARSVALRGREGGATAELGDDAAHALRASNGGGDKAHALIDATRTYDIAPCIGASGRGFSRTGDTRGQDCVVAFCENQRAEISLNDTAGALQCSGDKPGQGYPAVHVGAQVRRLTPKECARLQGFPDDYLDIPYRGKPAADGPKYKALGNSMAVPVMRWIGERIALVDQIPLAEAEAA